MKTVRSILLFSSLLFFGIIVVDAAAPMGGYLPGATNNPDCTPGDTDCFVHASFLTGELDPIYTNSPSFGIGTGNISNWNTAFGWGNHAAQGYLTGAALSGLNFWQFGGSAAGGQTLGSTDSRLPFMSNGNVMMQLDNSNLSLSNNQSFVDIAGRNGVFIGNHNTYGNSDNVLGIGETLDIRDGNMNIVTLGHQIDHIENNQNAFFGGENISGMSGNKNFFSFGNSNSYFDNTDSAFFGFKNTWTSEISKFIIGSNDKKWFQVDIDTGEILFANNAGTLGQALTSQGPGNAPQWQDIPTGGVNATINGLSLSGSSVKLGGTLIENTVITHAGRTLSFDLSTITTQNGVNILSNVLTTGTMLNLDSSYNLLNSSNGLLRVANTSTSTNGLLARFQANSTLDSGVTFLTNGNVGIGDSSPTSLLSVGSGDLFQVNTSGFALAQGGTAGNPSYTFVADPDTGMYRPANNSLRFAAGGNTIGRMDTTGWMLGDGGIAPVSLVHIGGGVNPSTFRMTNNTSGNTITDGFFINYSTGSIVNISNLENADMTFGTNNLERMKILANGNIAVSQTGATERLEVNGAIKVGNTATICSAGSAGTIRWNGSNFQGCTGTGWINF